MSSGQFQRDELDVWAGFLRTHSSITRLLSAGLEREHGLTVREFELLLILADVSPDGLRLTDLAERVYLTPGGLSRLVVRMEQRGLVQRATDPQDQRSSTISNTAAGSQLFRRASSSHRRRVREHFLGRITPEQRGVLADVWRELDD